MKSKSLSKSIIVTATCVLAIVVVIICVIYNTLISMKYFDKEQVKCYNATMSEAETMNSWLTKHETIVDDIVGTIYYNDLHGDKLKKYLSEYVLNISDSIQDCYFAWESEAPMIKCGIFEPGPDFIPQERGWYKEAVSQKKTIFTAPYVDAFTGKIVVTIASPLIVDDKVLGCCGIDIELTKLVDLTKEMKIDQNGYAMLIDGSDTIVVHSQNDEFSHRTENGEEVITKLTDVSPIYENILANVGNQENIIKCSDYDGVTRFYCAVPLGSTDWKIIYAADYKEATQDIVTFTIIIITLGVTGMLFGGIYIGIKFSRRVRPLKYLEEIVVNMAEGNLNHTFPECVNDEIGTINNALEQTCITLNSYIDEIERILVAMANGNFNLAKSEDVYFKGEFVVIGESLDRIQGAMRNVFANIDNVTLNVSDGSRSVAENSIILSSAASEEATLVSDVLSRINDITEHVAVSANNSLSANNETIKAADIVKNSSEKMNELLCSMKNIEEMTNEIVKINKTIEDIAFQTNILALNASVEAARAGAAGKGFAVVADEVRNLATKSAEASNTTSRLISETVNVVSEGTTLANETADCLANVVRQTEIIENAISEIADVSAEQKNELSAIVEKLQKISNVVDSTAATAKTSAAASKELDGHVIMLKDSVNKFNL